MSTLLVADKQSANGVTPTCLVEGWCKINSNWDKHTA